MFDSFVFPVRITRYPKDKQTFPSISRLLVTLNLAAERRRFVATLEENLQGLLLDKNLYRRKKKEDNSICQYPSFYSFFWGKMRHRNTWHWHPQQSWDVCSNCCLDKLGNQPTCPFSDVILLHRLIAGHKGIKMTPY